MAKRKRSRYDDEWEDAFDGQYRETDYDEEDRKKSRPRMGCGFKIVLFAVLFLVLVLVAFLLLTGSLFNVSEIQVYGAVTKDTQAIIAASGIDTDTNIFFVNEADAKARIEQDPALVVKDIQRVFPTGVAIYVQERLPLAQIGTALGYYVIDENGTALAVGTGKLEGLIEVCNFSIMQPEGGKPVVGENDEAVPNLIRVLTAIRKYGLDTYILSVDMQDPAHILLKCENGVTVRIAGAATAEKRLAVLRQTVESVRDRIEPGQILHMETEEGFYIGAPA